MKDGDEISLSSVDVLEFSAIINVHKLTGYLQCTCVFTMSTGPFRIDVQYLS